MCWIELWGTIHLYICTFSLCISINPHEKKKQNSVGPKRPSEYPIFHFVCHRGHTNYDFFFFCIPYTLVHSDYKLDIVSIKRRRRRWWWMNRNKTNTYATDKSHREKTENKKRAKRINQQLSKFENATIKVNNSRSERMDRRKKKLSLWKYMKYWLVSTEI